jgi:hypothetical protein
MNELTLFLRFAQDSPLHSVQGRLSLLRNEEEKGGEFMRIGETGITCQPDFIYKFVILKIKE